MKTSVLLSGIFLLLFSMGCSWIPFLSKAEEEPVQTEATTSPAEEQVATQPVGTVEETPVQSNTALDTEGSTVSRVSVPFQTGSKDQEYVINEMAFELKKLSAEVKHLGSELRDLQARSEMWMNPLAVYNKEIILKNGTSYYGKIIYQDEKVIKVETLIGYLVIERTNVVRIVENIPEEPPTQYLPEELTQTSGSSAQTQVKAPLYVPQTGQPSEAVAENVASANCVLVGTIAEKKDKSGNTIFEGEIKNIGARRADFVKINFVFRKNWSGDTQALTAFVKGSYHTFDSGVTTDATLLPGASGKFELFIPRSFGSYIGYSYSIAWEQYE